MHGHKEIPEMTAELPEDSALEKLADIASIEQHIRFEERELFPYPEETLKR